jgi:DNA-binding beta-propeller fold protein YncE
MRFSIVSLTVLAAAVLLTACAQSGAPAVRSADSSRAEASVGLPAVQRAALGQGLYELAYSERQNALFVTSTGGFGPGSQAARLLRLDPQTLALQAEIALPLKGFGVALDDEAGRLYVGHTMDASVSVIDIASNRLISTIKLADKVKSKTPDGREVERAPHNFRELVLDRANHRLYLPGLSMDESALYVVDTRALKLEKVVPGLGQGATGVALDAKGNRLFISNLVGQITVLDTVGLVVHKRYDSGGDQPLNLAYDAASDRLFATDQGLQMLQDMRQKKDASYRPRAGNRVLVLNASSGKLITSLPTGEGPVALTLDAARQRLYVSNRGAGTVSAFDSKSYQLLQTVSLPVHPNSLALDARNNVLYVSVKNARDAAKDSQESVARLRF